MTRTTLLPALWLFAAMAPSSLLAQQKPEPLRFEGARTEVYKKIGDVELEIHVFEPATKAEGEAKRAAIVFFFGGGWTSGTPKQFEHQCRYLAGRGMVAMAADYRVSSRHGTKAVQCVTDGKSAIRWVRANAARLGVDPQRIVAAGGSAGGHVAACTGTIEGLDEKGEDLEIGSRPNAMVLFNPVLVLAPVEGTDFADPERVSRWKERLGVDPEELSPYHHVAKGAPPTLIFHGKADKTVPYETAELFAEAMKKAGNECRLSGFDGAGHGFFNHGRGGGKAYRETVAQMDAFLTGFGYLAEKK